MKTTKRGYQYPESSDMAKNFPSIAATTITKIDADMTTALTRQMTPGPKGDKGPPGPPGPPGRDGRDGGSVPPWQTGTAGADTVIDPSVGSFARIRDNGDQTVTVACVLQTTAWPKSDTAVERELAVVPLIDIWLTAAALIVPIVFSKGVLDKDVRALPARCSVHSTGDLALIIEQPPGTRMNNLAPIAFTAMLALPA
ncbi:hypothetical protein [Brevibacterium otitidis]|uniref:Collagen triple helix repeat-containing protein n=1 Tax=Brevibacterium otitidis TaxID=53364 RepID=A0ABV5X378_9MICO|nr:hypothetical protein GCM10023233_27340 [Brevibacterium otitidis]